MGREYSTYGERRVLNRVLVGKLEGKRHLGKHRRRWEDNTEMYIRKLNWRNGLD